jgi:FtsP/CotA-like multicopper oxidase with cupredoxin domain
MSWRAALPLILAGLGVGCGTPATQTGTEDPLSLAARAHTDSFLAHFDYGKISKLPDGRTLREYWIRAEHREIEVAPGVRFPAWTFNGAVPGPTLRATQGDVVRIHFHNAGTMSHSMHFHGFHAANMDGVFEQVRPEQDFVYEFVAEPFGLHVYHCHTMPVKMHIARGLYGVFIVDPPTPRPAMREMVMLMNGFDTDLNGEDNEFYTVNGYANYYFKDKPIQLKVDERVRIYLVNMTEFDLLNSMHTHATFFDVYRTGTRLTPDEFTDTISMGQGERAIIEFNYHEPGKYLFHAHVNEFAELGWLGLFEVTP